MAKEKVTKVKAALSSLDLSKAGSGIKLVIEYDGSKLGEITIGHGSLRWKPVNKQAVQVVSWKDFASKVANCQPIF